MKDLLAHHLIWLVISLAMLLVVVVILALDHQPVDLLLRLLALAGVVVGGILGVAKSGP